MANFDAKWELQYTYDKLIYFGQNQWINLILADWHAAYKKAYDNVFGVTDTPAWPLMLEMFGTLVGEVALPVEFFFIPFAFALNTLAVPTPIVPKGSTPDPDEFMLARTHEFGQMFAAHAKALLDILSDVKNGKQKLSEPDFDQFLSYLLVSPIWYPPPEPDVDELARRIELRMWSILYAEGKISGRAFNTLNAPVPDLAKNLNGQYTIDEDLAADMRAKMFRYRFSGGGTQQQRDSILQDPTFLAMYQEVGRQDPFYYKMWGYIRRFVQKVKDLNIDTFYRVRPTAASQGIVINPHWDWTMVGYVPDPKSPPMPDYY